MTLELTIKVTLILLAVSTGAFLLRRSSAATRHLLQTGALSAVLVLPLAVVALPTWELPLLPATTGGVTLAAYPAAMAAPKPAPKRRVRSERLPGEDCDCSPSTGVDRARDDSKAILLAGIPIDPVAPGGTPAAPVRWALWLWAAGATFVLGRLGLHWLRMMRLAIGATPLEYDRIWRIIHNCRARLGILRTPQVLTSASVAVPVLWGFLRPTLLLPEAALGWSSDRLRVVLLHELAHLRRMDGLGLMIGRIAAAIWWFHPMVWIVERSARRDCERACDDVVLASGERPSRYAEHLLEIAGELPPNAVAPAGALALTGPGPLECRLRSILRPDLRRGLGLRGAMIALSCLTVALVSVSSARLIARPVEQSADAITASGSEAAPEIMLAHGGEGGEKAEYLLTHDGDHEGEDAYERASELHQEESFAEAAELFEEAAKAGFHKSTALYNAGCGYARLGRTAEAITALEAAVDAGFDSWKYFYEDSDLDPIRGENAFRRMMDGFAEERKLGRLPRTSRYDQIIEDYEELRQDDTADGDDWYETGSALLSVREFDMAVDALGRAAELLGDHDANAQYNLACAYSLQGDKRRALDQLERAVLAGFDSEERFANDSDLDNLRAEPRFTEIAELHDFLSMDRFERWNQRGSTEYSERRWKPAIEEFSAFVAENPDVGRAWRNLGWALHFSHRHAEARDAFQRQLDLGFRAAIATYNIACTHAMENQTDQAIDWLERAMTLESVSPWQLIDDEDLKSLHDDPRFETLLEQAVKDRQDADDESDDDLDHLLERWQFKKRANVRQY